MVQSIAFFQIHCLPLVNNVNRSKETPGTASNRNRSTRYAQHWTTFSADKNHEMSNELAKGLTKCRLSGRRVVGVIHTEQKMFSWRTEIVRLLLQHGHDFRELFANHLLRCLIMSKHCSHIALFINYMDGEDEIMRDAMTHAAIVRQTAVRFADHKSDPRS